MSDRLPAHLEISGLIRAVDAAGGFATVLARGERDAGTILVVCCEHGVHGRIYERMPQLDGTREWTLIKSQDVENTGEFSEYLSRRKRQDADLWILELDIADAERFHRIRVYREVDTQLVAAIWRRLHAKAVYPANRPVRLARRRGTAGRPFRM